MDAKKFNLKFQAIYSISLFLIVKLIMRSKFNTYEGIKWTIILFGYAVAAEIVAITLQQVSHDKMFNVKKRDKERFLSHLKKSKKGSFNFVIMIFFMTMLSLIPTSETNVMGTYVGALFAGTCLTMYGGLIRLIENFDMR